jgi:putative Mg2+ transporter-C (MgtC) family protein
LNSLYDYYAVWVQVLIGFLGAGIILKEGINIHGLTTAATVWCSADAGSLAACGYYVETFYSDSKT